MVDIGRFEPDDIKNIPTFRAAYSDRTALLMGKLAYRAYEKFDADDDSWLQFSATFRELGLVESAALIDRATGTAGFVVAGDEIIAVVFRGTEDELDWTTNVRAEWITLQGGTRVHTGFFQAYWPVRNAMFKEIERLVRMRPRPVYVTGHSLGGALALMATAELANHQDATIRDSIAACYTFGCPRAGDASFDLYVKAPLYRVTNGIDIVPAVPPAIMGFRHVGDTRYFGVLGAAPSRRSPSFLQKLWRTLFSVIDFLRTSKLRSIADHGMNVYIAKLSAWADVNVQQTRQRRVETADPEIKTK